MDQLLKNLFPFLTRDMLSFGHESKLQLRITTDAQAVNIISVKGMTRSAPFTYKHTTASSGVATSSLHGLSDIPIMISVSDDTGSFLANTCYVQVDLLVNGDRVFQMAAGYIGNGRSISWPNSNAENNLKGHGGLENFNGTNPAANTELGDSVPTNESWILHGMSVSLVTDANVANRRVHLKINPANGGSLHAFPSIDQTAGQTIQYCFAEYGTIPDELDNNVILVNIPTGIILPSGSTITTATLNRQVGDDFGQPTYYVEKFQGATF